MDEELGVGWVIGVECYGVVVVGRWVVVEGDVGFGEVVDVVFED